MISLDVRLATRRLLSRPGYTALLVVIVGVGVGAATTVFSVVDQMLLRPAPFAYADRLVDVLDTNRADRGGGNSLSPAKIAGWQTQPSLFERFEAYAPLQLDITGDAEPERVSGLNISLGLFSMLGVGPRLGRAFIAGDGRSGAERVVIISDDLWRRRFAAQADALGRRLRLNDEDYTIVGVMPRRFRMLSDKESVWLPIDVAPNVADAGTRWNFYGLGRLARGVQFSDAQALANTIADRLQAATPIARSWDLTLQKKRIARVDATTTTALLVLLGAVSFVLFITCANVASLFLSNAPLRLREMAIRSALGASRARLIRSVLAESLLLASAGGALGVVLARWGLDVLLAGAPANLAFMTTSTVEIDMRVVAVAVTLTLVTGVVIGLLPALRGSQPNVEATLRGSAPAAGGAFGRAPGGLVMLEMAFSVMLLIGAALMARTMARLAAIEPGFEPDGLIALHVDLPSDRYPGSQARVAFFETLFEWVKGVPGISEATAASGMPPAQGGFSFGPLEGEGSAVAPASAIVPINTITPGYFRTLRIPLLAGRTFGPGDTEDTVIVSKGLADHLWPEGAAVGRRFRIGDQPWRTIVGIAGNVETRAAGDTRSVFQIYYPWVPRPPAAASTANTARRRTYAWTLLIVRAQDPAAALPEIKRRIWAMDPNQPVERVAMATDVYAEAFGRQRFVLMLMSTFSAIALALTAAGIFGMVSQTVMRRTREIGIRMALGARPIDVLRDVIARALVLTIAGVALGIGGAFLLTGVLRTLLFEVSPTDPMSFVAVGLFLLAVALLACWVPARAATRVQPSVALRVE